MRLRGGNAVSVNGELTATIETIEKFTVQRNNIGKCDIISLNGTFR